MIRCKRCYIALKRAEERDTSVRDAYALGYRDGYADGKRVSYRPVLDAMLLRQLIMLCHPDRHPPERAGMANAATAALIGLRDSKA
jgi:hypothetical protein